jgi:phosphotransferase system  glucose/maltose/N-acetylglucosamine-specific IIC component
MKRWRVEHMRKSGEISAVLVEADDADAAAARATAKGLRVVRVAPLKDAPPAAPDASPEASASRPHGVLDPSDVDRVVRKAIADQQHAVLPDWTAAAARAEKRAHRSARSANQGAVMLTLGIVGLVLAMIVAAASDMGEEGAMLVGAVSTFLLILGAIYNAVGRLGVDLAETHEQRAHTGNAEER